MKDLFDTPEYFQAFTEQTEANAKVLIFCYEKTREIALHHGLPQETAHILGLLFAGADLVGSYSRGALSGAAKQLCTFFFAPGVMEKLTQEILGEIKRLAQEQMGEAPK